MTAQVAESIDYWRSHRGWSAQKLADRCDKLGMAIPRNTIDNLENGRRTTITVGELLVLSEALGVPPILLLVPYGRADTVEVLPGVEGSVTLAAAWIEGSELDPVLAEQRRRAGDFVDGAPLRTLTTAAPSAGATTATAPPTDEPTVKVPVKRLLALMRQHRAAAGFLDASFEDLTNLFLYRDDPAEAERLVMRARKRLGDARAELRSAGLVPPAISDDLARQLGESSPAGNGES